MLINSSVLITPEITVALNQIVPAFDGPSPKPIHPEWRYGLNVVVN
jgi:hypothetical protein